MSLQHHETLKRKFNQLLTWQIQSTVKIEKLEQELGVCRGQLDQHRDCKQLREQVELFVAQVTAIGSSNSVQDSNIPPTPCAGSMAPPQMVRQIA